MTLLRLLRDVFVAECFRAGDIRTGYGVLLCAGGGDPCHSGDTP